MKSKMQKRFSRVTCYKLHVTYSRGFTLIEMLVGIAIFTVIFISIYQVYVSLFSFISLNQYKILALNLGNEQIEIARNLAYSDVGVVDSIPDGKIPHIQSLNRGGKAFTVTTTIRNIDLPFDGTIGGSPNDLSPADNKQIEVEITCPTCKNLSPLTLTATIAPKNLETASTNGALFIKVFDANGIALAGASVHVVNAVPNPDIVIDDVTNTSGMLQIVDAPPGVEAYEITVTKTGYSSDRTYLTGASGNPTPSKPHATVLLGQVTQVSFSIDRTSVVSMKSVTPLCVPVPDVHFTFSGSKTIGPGVLKYSANLATNGSGTYTNNALEWDTYTIVGTDATNDIVGINPLNPVAVNPGSAVDVSLTVVPVNPKSLLVTVKDSATELPVTGATVTLTKSPSYDSEQITGSGYINQTDWSGGSGQDLFTDPLQYMGSDGNIETSSPGGEIKLKNLFGTYKTSGTLESSTFDTGSPSNFYNLKWIPTDEPIPAGPNSVRFQFASTSTLPFSGWEYKGPDGTSGTYYTSSNTSLSSVHTGDRYARYKVFLSTDDTAFTPNISDIAFTFTSECTPPGQVVFSGLASGTYHVSVSKSGYSTSELDIPVTLSWQEQDIVLTP
ncbi:MAG: prepilin-type N-terminal cleavage/methylation domain-containing protein [Candidatus Taylorbacteria bacterium]